MTPEEYRKAIQLAEKAHKQTIEAINATYAHANNHVRVGDIVQGMHSKIIVENMVPIVHPEGALPQMIYMGVRAKQNDEAWKNGSLEVVYQRQYEMAKKILGGSE